MIKKEVPRGGGHPLHLGWLNPAITSSVGDSTVQFLVVGELRTHLSPSHSSMSYTLHSVLLRLSHLQFVTIPFSMQTMQANRYVDI